MPRFIAIGISIVWFLFIVFGFYQVYLFINGYPLFSFATKELQKGYVNFESDIVSDFFLDKEYVGTQKIHALFPVGTYEMCAEKLTYQNRCFANSTVNTNDLSMLQYAGIVLLPLDMTPRMVTSEKVFLLPNKKGFFWYDTDKKQIFWIDKKSTELQSFYPPFVPDEIEFNEENNEYFLLKKKTKTQKEQKYVLSFPAFYFDIPEKPSLYEPLSVFQNGIFHNSVPENIAGKSQQTLVAWFSETMEESFYFGSKFSKVFIFPNRALLYSFNGNDFRHLFEKDPNTPVLYFEKTRQFWFQKNEKLYVLQL